MSFVPKVALGATLLAAGLGFLWPFIAGDRETPNEAAQPGEAHERAPVEAESSPGTLVLEESTDRAAASKTGVAVIDLNNIGDLVAFAGPPGRRFPAAFDIDIVEPSTIEGVALRSYLPIDEGIARYGRVGEFGSSEDWDHPVGVPSPAAMGSRRLRSDGTFRIEGLADGTYWVGIDLGRGIEAQAYCEVSANRRSSELEFHLGSARIEGRVYDAQGQPVGGTEVRLESHFIHAPFWTTTSGPDGTYAIEGLPAASFAAWAVRPGERRAWADSPGMRWLRDLRDKETRVADFGTPPRNTRWTGRIVDATGTIIELDGELLFECEGWHGHGSEPPLQVKRGRFDLQVAPGTHSLRVHCTVESVGGPGQAALAIGRERFVPVDAGTEDLERDLVLPGSTVRGYFAGVTAMPNPRQSSAWLCKKDASTRSAQVGEDGTFRVYALEPGEWTVRVESRGRTVGETTLTVLASDLTLDVLVPLARR